MTSTNTEHLELENRDVSPRVDSPVMEMSGNQQSSPNARIIGKLVSSLSTPYHLVHRIVNGNKHSIDYTQRTAREQNKKNFENKKKNIKYRKIQKNERNLERIEEMSYGNAGPFYVAPDLFDFPIQMESDYSFLKSLERFNTANLPTLPLEIHCIMSEQLETKVTVTIYDPLELFEMINSCEIRVADLTSEFAFIEFYFPMYDGEPPLVMDCDLFDDNAYFGIAIKKTLKNLGYLNWTTLDYAPFTKFLIFKECFDTYNLAPATPPAFPKARSNASWSNHFTIKKIKTQGIDVQGFFMPDLAPLKDELVSDISFLVRDEIEHVNDKLSEQRTAFASEMQEVMRDSIDRFTEKAERSTMNVLEHQNSGLIDKLMENPKIHSIGSMFEKIDGFTDFLLGLIPKSNISPIKIVASIAAILGAYKLGNHAAYAAALSFISCLAGDAYLKGDTTSGHAMIVPLLLTLYLHHRQTKSKTKIDTQGFDNEVFGSLHKLLLRTSNGIRGASEFFQLKTFATFTRDINSISNFITTVVNAFINFYNNHIAERLGFSRFEDLTGFSTAARKIIDDIKYFKTEASNGEMVMSEDTLGEVTLLLTSAEELYAKMPHLKGEMNKQRIFLSYITQLREIQSKLQNLRLSLGGFRFESIPLCLQGTPGTYKTTIIRHVTSGQMAIAASDKQYEQHCKDPTYGVYNRVKETSYFDGYYQDTIVTNFDDFGQARDVVGSPDCEFMEVIRMVNSNEYILHSAALENKGNLKFRSKFVNLTTNATHLSSAAILDINAVHRRIDGMRFRPVPKEEFATDGVLDLSKIPQIDENGVNVADILPEHFIFRELDKDGNVFGNPLQFTDIMDRLKKKYVERTAQLAVHKRNFTATAKEYRAKFYDGRPPLEPADKWDLEMKEITPQSNSDEDTMMEEFHNLATTLDRNFPDEQAKIEKFMKLLTLVNPEDMYQNLTPFFTGIPPKTETDLWLHYLLYRSEPRIWLSMFVHGDLYLEPRQIRPVLYIPPVYLLTEEIKNKFNKFKTWVCNNQLTDSLSQYLSLIEKDTTFQKYKQEIKVIAATLAFVGIAKLAYNLVYSEEKEKKNIEHGDSVDLLQEAKELPLKISNTQAREYIRTVRSSHDTRILSLAQLKASLAKSSVLPQGACHFPEDALTYKAVAQGADNLSPNMQILKSIIQSNLASLTMNGVHIVHALFVDTSIAIIPLHTIGQLVTTISKTGMLDLKCFIGDRLVGVYQGSDLEKDTYEGPLFGTHLVLMRFQNCTAKKNIIGNFLKEKTLNSFKTIFSVIFKADNHYYNSEAYVAHILTREYLIPHTFRYFSNTRDGDCGFPIMVNSSSAIPNVICGIHVAGSSDGSYNAYATFITEEQVRKTYEEFCGMSVHLQSVAPFIAEKFKVLGEVEHSHSPYSFKNDFRNSVIAEYDGNKPSKAPAMVRPTRGIDPFEKMLAKYCVGEVSYCKESAAYAAGSLKDFVLSQRDLNLNRRILTLEEALWGDPTDPSWSAISSSSSPGYPMKYEPPELNYKKLLLGENMIRDSSNPVFAKYNDIIRGIEKDCARGIRKLWIFTDNLKTELRSLEKVENGDTRGFQGAPFDYVVICRKYFGSFVKHVYANRIDNETAIGINYYSAEWTALARKLNKFTTVHEKTRIGAGDFKCLDGSEKPFIHEIILEIINSWYDDEHTETRKILWMEVTNSRHIYMKYIYEWFASLPSGHPLTIHINCLYVQYAFRYCFYRIVKNPSARFEDHVSLVVLGDDNIFSAHESIADLFNEMTLPSLMAEIGLKYTNEVKSESLIPWREIHEVSFLKRGFRWDNLYSLYLAPLSIDTILETPRWTKRGINSITIQVTNIENFFEELSLHDEDTFNKYATLMRRALRTQPLLTSATNYEEYRVVQYRVMRRSRVHSSIFDLILREIGEESTSTAILVESENGTIDNDSPLPIEECPGFLKLTTRVGREQPSHDPGIVLQSVDWVADRPSNSPATNTQTTGESSTSIVDNYEHVRSEDISVGVAATTTFQNDKAINVAAPVQPERVSAKYYALTGGDIPSDVSSFLAKPRIFVSGNLSLTDTATTFPRYMLPYDMLQRNVYKDKLRGFYGFRATTVLRLTVNAERFQQGRYMLTYVPLGGARTDTNGDYWIEAHSATLVQRSQLPRVEFDISTDTMVELRIPFSSAMDFYPLSALRDINNYASQGAVRIFPYSALQSVSGSTTCGFTLWAHYEDVELIYPAVPQDIDVQSVDVTRVEASSGGAGPISSVALKIASAASVLGKVPLIGSYAQTLGWASNIVGNIASVFGWSAPRQMAPATRVTTGNFSYHNNINKVDNSFNLALDNENKVSVFPGFADQGVDEMDISYLASIPFYFDQFLFEETKIAGDLLWSTNVAPGSYVSINSGTTTTSYNVGPMQWLCQNFTYWRGSITFRFKMVKTEFHSGRIAVCFTPLSRRSTFQLLTYFSSDYVYRDIIDIREHTSFTITVPFISTVPYKQSTLSADDFIGQLAVYVVDKLVSPDTVTSNVKFLMEKCGGPDFEVAVPNFNMLTPSRGVDLQSKDASSLFEKTIGTAVPGRFQLETSQAAIGERVVSLRALLKRSFLIKTGTTHTASKYLNVIPFGWTGTRAGLSENTITEYGDLYTALCSMFCYSRGGVRFKHLPTSNPDNITSPFLISQILKLADDTLFAGSSTVYSIGSTDQNGSDVDSPYRMAGQLYKLTDNKVERGPEYEVPQYSWTHSRANADYNLVAGFDNRLASTVVPWVVTTSAVTLNAATKPNLAYLTLRSGAEDTNFSTFVSVPAMARL